MKSLLPPIAAAVNGTKTDFGNMNYKNFPMRSARKYRVPLSTRNKQIEQNRTPVVYTYLQELAGYTAYG
jgi:hypothetical protein